MAKEEPANNKELIRRWLAFAEAGFPGPFAEYIQGNYVGHRSGVDMGCEELERIERLFVSAFPNATYSIEDLIADGDRVVLRVITRGQHCRDYYGIAATGRDVEFSGIVIYRIEDGRIAESWGEVDFGGLMKQLRQS